MLSQQADRIIAKFGSVTKLAKAIGVSSSAIYKWTYGAEKKGCEGVIPRKHIQKIRDAADVIGVELTEEDWKV